MSELMGGIRAEPKPGTALRAMMTEHRHLDEFMAMVKAKMDLDEKYLGELKTLRDLWNPGWNNSGVWPLISPLLTHINNEIDEREKVGAELSSRFAAVPNPPSPNALYEDGFDPLETLENLDTRYHHYEQCHKVICTPKSISELQRWWSNQPNTLTWRGAPLPKHERAYRAAVVAQQTTVEPAAKWHKNTLPAVLERHQQRPEDIKEFLNTLFICDSTIYSSLSISCSTALRSTQAFHPSRFIAPRHDETEKEASHAFLQAVHYRNYMQGGEVTQPIFGLGVEKTVSLINELLNNRAHLPPYYSAYPGWLSLVMELERAATQSELPALLGRSKIQSLVTSHSGRACISLKLLQYTLSAFLLDEPVLPLPTEVITQYRNGISRAKLSSLMATHLPLARQEAVKLMVRIANQLNERNRNWSKELLWKRIGTYLSHSDAAGPIIASICRKWDILNDCPLPEGVERVWGEQAGESKVVWKKTGDPYYTAMASSSA